MTEFWERRQPVRVLKEDLNRVNKRGMAPLLTVETALKMAHLEGGTRDHLRIGNRLFGTRLSQRESMLPGLRFFGELKAVIDLYSFFDKVGRREVNYPQELFAINLLAIISGQYLREGDGCEVTESVLDRIVLPRVDLLQDVLAKMQRLRIPYVNDNSASLIIADVEGRRVDAIIDSMSSRG